MLALFALLEVAFLFPAFILFAVVAAASIVCLWATQCCSLRALPIATLTFVYALLVLPHIFLIPENIFMTAAQTRTLLEAKLNPITPDRVVSEAALLLIGGLLLLVTCSAFRAASPKVRFAKNYPSRLLN